MFKVNRTIESHETHLIPWSCIYIQYNSMKKLIPLLLLSSATLYSTIGTLPVSAMGCNSSSNKAEVVCAEGDIDCEKKLIEDRIN